MKKINEVMDHKHLFGKQENLRQVLGSAKKKVKLTQTASIYTDLNHPGKAKKILCDVIMILIELNSFY